MNIASPPSLSALSLPWPPDWTVLFGADSPLIVEIGFGTGTYLRHLAETRPDCSIIGLEISNRCLARAERLIAQRGYDHVRVVHSPAETALRHLFAPGQLSEVVINYPDPWFKRDHSHRRLIQRDTADALSSRLAPGGTLSLATDIAEYALMAHEVLSATSGLRNMLNEPFADALPGRVVTKYEARARAQGRRSYYLLYRRTDEPVPPLPVIQELPVPHAVIASPLTLPEIRARFMPFQASEGGLHVGFGEVFEGRRSLLFEIHASEPTIDQHTALLLTPHGSSGGAYTVQLSTIGHPRATEGLHLAVLALAEWVVSLADGSAVLSQKIADDN